MSGGAAAAWNAKRERRIGVNMTGQTRAERQTARTERRTASGGRGTRKGRKKSKHELRKDYKSLRRAAWKAAAGNASTKKAKTGQTARRGVMRARGSHPGGACGNVGCVKCNPLLVQSIRTNPESCDVRREGGVFAS